MPTKKRLLDSGSRKGDLFSSSGPSITVGVPHRREVSVAGPASVCLAAFCIGGRERSHTSGEGHCPPCVVYGCLSYLPAEVDYYPTARLSHLTLAVRPEARGAVARPAIGHRRYCSAVIVYCGLITVTVDFAITRRAIDGRRPKNLAEMTAIGA